MARAFLLALLPLASADLALQSLSAYPTAVCTDGSPAGYYFKPSASGSSDLWILYHQGGGWCYDEASCATRCGTPAAPKTSSTLCSSKAWKATIPLGGIFYPSSDTALADANKVYIQYCTSDGHMGDAGASASTFGWHFRGHAVLRATIAELVAKHGLGGTAASIGKQQTIIYGGGSAGARGSMVHLDYIQSMVRDAAAPATTTAAAAAAAAAPVTVVGFLDSPAWIDEAPYPTDHRFPGFNVTTQGVYKIANVTHLGTRCAAAHPASSGEAWKCLFGQYRLPTIDAPFLVVGAQDDAFQLGENLPLGVPVGADQLAYAARFANRTRALMAEVIASAGPTQLRSVFSQACHSHSTSLTGKGFDEVTCDKRSTRTAAATANRLMNGPGRTASSSSTMHGALNALLAAVHGTTPTPSTDLAWVDSCNGYACGAGCSGTMAAGYANDQSGKTGPFDVNLNFSFV
eukprot:g3776.t1